MKTNLRRWNRSLFLALSVTAILQQPSVGAAEPEGPKHVANCWEARFADPVDGFALVRQRDGAPLYLISADDPCLEGDPLACGNRRPLDQTHQWFAGSVAGGWVCVTDGRAFGWTPRSEIDVAPIAPTRAKDWLGRWQRQYGGASIRIRLAKDGKTLLVKGDAEWRAGPDATPHLGDIDQQGVVTANEVRLGEPKCLDYDYGENHKECHDCVARLMLINSRIFIRDNHLCGGMNVNFDGIYDRVR